MSTKHIVGFSCGIDSQAALRWVRNRYGDDDTIALCADPGGNEDPFTYEFREQFSSQVFPLTVCVPRVRHMWEEGSSKPAEYGLDPDAFLDFPTLISRKGVPTGKRKTCTYLLKLVPQREWMRIAFSPGGEFEGWDYIRYTGLRRDESRKRANTPFEEFDEFFDCTLRHPVADWTKQMCFDYVRSFNEPINPLYSMGFNRVGCAPCVESNKADILNWAIRRPEMIEKIAHWEETTTLPGREEPGFNWFSPLTPTGKHNRIHDVVDWAKTSRGGKQHLFPIFHERESCESKYGLCE